MLIKGVRARYSKGSLVPLQGLNIKEGDVVTISIEIEEAEDRAARIERGREAMRRAAGGWKGLVDTDKLLKDIYEARAAGIELPPED